LVEDSLVLDLDQLVRDGILQPQRSKAGRLTWTIGEDMATVNYEARWGSRSGELRLCYAMADAVTGTVVNHDERVALTATTPPFGGLRWWFRCPVTNRLARKLYLPPGADWFANRAAHRLGYETQRRAERAGVKLQAIRRRLGADPNQLLLLARRPKGMHSRTFRRLRTEGHTAEMATLEAFVSSLARFDPQEAKRARRDLDELRRVASALGL
jgi:hypothetical protein